MGTEALAEARLRGLLYLVGCVDGNDEPIGYTDYKVLENKAQANNAAAKVQRLSKQNYSHPASVQTIINPILVSAQAQGSEGHVLSSDKALSHDGMDQRIFLLVFMCIVVSAMCSTCCVPIFGYLLSIGLQKHLHKMCIFSFAAIASNLVFFVVWNDDFFCCVNCTFITLHRSAWVFHWMCA